MVLIEWNKLFEVGVPAVDLEHQQFIKRINALYDQLQELTSAACLDDGYGVNITDFLGAVYALVERHFDREEVIMRSHEYSGLPQHKADHEQLLDELNQTMYDYQDGVLNDDETLAQFLTGWFINHFQTHDAALHALAKLPVHS